LIEPEDESRGEGDGGEEGVRASVVSGVDTPPVLEAGEEVFDFVPLAIEDRVVAVLDLVLGMGRDARGDAPLPEGLAEPDRAIGAVGQQIACWRQGFDQQVGSGVVAGLAFGQVKDERAALTVANHLQLGGQPASTAPDTSG
jgi:hypothetical protein